jgi:hypothetical protein
MLLGIGYFDKFCKDMQKAFVHVSAVIRMHDCINSPSRLVAEAAVSNKLPYVCNTLPFVCARSLFFLHAQLTALINTLIRVASKSGPPCPLFFGHGCMPWHELTRLNGMRM